MDVPATLFNKSLPCKILNSTVWLLRLRGLTLFSPAPSQGERFCARRGEEEKKNI